MTLIKLENAIIAIALFLSIPNLTYGNEKSAQFHAQATKLARDFSQSSSEIDKYYYSFSMRTLLSDMENISISESDLSEYKKISSLSESIDNATIQFEKSIPRDELSKLLHINKKLLPYSNVGLSILNQEKCSRADLEKVTTENYNLILAGNNSLRILPGLYKDKLLFENFTVFEELASSRNTEGKAQAKLHYATVKKFLTQNEKEKTLSRISLLEKKLVETWKLPKEKVQEKILELESLIPACLSSADYEGTVNLIRNEITRKKGERIFRSLQDYYSKTKKVPEEIEEFVQPIAGDPIYGDLLDGHNQHFMFYRSEDKLILKSLDWPTPAAKNSIYIGEIKVPPLPPLRSQNVKFGKVSAPCLKEDGEKFLSDVQFLPHFGNGEVDGSTLHLKSLKSRWADLGLQTGDTILEVNGKTIGKNSDPLIDYFKEICEGKAKLKVFRGKERLILNFSP